MKRTKRIACGGVKNRIHALLHRQGVYGEAKSLFGGQGRRFLDALARNGRHAGGVPARRRAGVHRRPKARSRQKRRGRATPSIVQQAS